MSGIGKPNAELSALYIKSTTPSLQKELQHLLVFPQEAPVTNELDIAYGEFHKTRN